MNLIKHLADEYTKGTDKNSADAYYAYIEGFKQALTMAADAVYSCDADPTGTCEDAIEELFYQQKCDNKE